jgi:hypothetical protein
VGGAISRCGAGTRSGHRALFSYHGGLFWGLNADWDALPDLHALAEARAADFEELRRAAAGRDPARLARR